MGARAGFSERAFRTYRQMLPTVFSRVGGCLHGGWGVLLGGLLVLVQVRVLKILIRRLRRFCCMEIDDVFETTSCNAWSM